MAGWSVSPADFIGVVEADIVKMQRGIVLDLMFEIAVNTAIDTGNYMGNSIVSIGAPDYSVNMNLDILGTEMQNAARAVLLDLKPYSKVFVQNNSPYGEMLEFGGYNGPTVKVTDAGYSRMAPRGTYGISVIAVSEKWA